jgi:hypothetical protein
MLHSTKQLPNSSAASTEQFASAIAKGIQMNGFHLAEEDQLSVLWPDEQPSVDEKLHRLRLFARAHSWEATGGRDCNIALFQVANRWTAPFDH